jgi:simple sugar transport system permease protein
LKNARLTIPAVLILLLVGFNVARVPGFLSIHVVNGALNGSLIDILNRAAPVMILSFGMTLVIATAGVDLSVGAILAISGSLCATLLTSAHPLPFFVVVAISLGLTTLLGLVNGVLVGVLRIQPIVATLVLMVAGRGIAQLITEGQMVRLSDETLRYWVSGRLFGLPTSIWAAAAVGLLAFVLTRLTALGLFIEATGENDKAAHMTGIPTSGVRMFVYAFSGLCAGVAGLVVMSDTHVADANSAGLYTELDAILSVVLGGTLLTGGRFSLAGTVLGALLIQTLTTTILTTGVKPEANLVVKAVAVLGACLVQSEQFRGAFRRRFR